MVKIPNVNVQTTKLIVDQSIVQFFLAPSDIPIKIAMWIPIRTGPSSVSPGRPYLFQILWARSLRLERSFSVSPFFSFRFASQVFTFSNPIMRRITVLRFPVNPETITQKGDKPRIIPSGITRAISNQGVAAAIKMSMYSMNNQQTSFSKLL